MVHYMNYNNIYAEMNTAMPFVFCLHCHHNIPTLYWNNPFSFPRASVNRSGKTMMQRLLFQACEHEVSCYSRSHASQLWLAGL